MKKAHNRFGSVFTIFLLAVFFAALLPPTATADIADDWRDLLEAEALEADDTPWVEGNEPHGAGSWYMPARIAALLMDAGLLDIGGYTQADSKSSNNCLKQDTNESNDFDILK